MADFSRQTAILRWRRAFHLAFHRTLALAFLVGFAWLGAAPVHAAMRVASGFYLGLGIVNQPVVTVGFAPDAVIVKAVTSQIAVCRAASMTGSKELGAATALQSNRILSLDPFGFTVGTHASVNALATVYHWVAFQSAPGEMEIRSYAGDGADDRSILGLGFEPEYAIVMSSSGQHAVQRFGTQADDASFRFDASAASSDRIQSFLTDGIELGSSAEVNGSGTTYHLLAWRRAASAVDVGSYSGDGIDGRSITDPGFRPDWMLVRGSSSQPVHRPASLLLDATLPFSASAQFADGIQGLEASGFEVGTHAAVNAAGSSYYYAAFADNPNGHADLSLALEADDLDPTEGQTVQFTVTLENAGPAEATSLVVDLPLPDGLTFVQSSGDGSYAPASGWSVSSIESGDQATLSVEGSVDLGTMGEELLVQAALSNSDQGDPTSNDHSGDVTLSVGGVDLAVAVAGSAETAAPGDTVSFTIALSNLSEGSATGVLLHDDLPSGITYVTHDVTAGAFDPASGEWSLSLDPSQDETLVLEGRVDDNAFGQTLTNIAMVLALDQTDPESANDEDSDSVYIPAADLEVEKNADIETPIPGTPVVFTITATNHGPDGATAIQIEDILPEALTFVLAVPSSGSYSAATGIWQIGALGAGQSAQLLLTALVDLVPEEGVIANTATRISSSPVDPDPGNDAATVILAPEGSDLDLHISASDLFPVEGDTVTLEIQVQNHGPAPTLAATVTTDLDSGLDVLSAEATGGVYALDSWVIPVLAVEQAETLTIQCRLAQGTGGTEQTAEGVVVLDPPFVDPISENDHDSVTLTVSEPASADLRIEVVADEPAPRSGDLVEITIHAYNDGPDAATGVAISVDVDSDLTYVSHASSQGSYDEASGNWTIGSLSTGAEEQLVLSRLVGTGAIGRDPAVFASVSAEQPPDPSPGNNQASIQVHVAAADLSLDLSTDNADPSRGDLIHIHVVLENSGPEDAETAVSVSLPQGVVVQSSSASKGSYDLASRVWSIGAIDAFQEEWLDLTAEVGSGSVVRTITASVIETDPDDPTHSDWTDSQVLHVHGVELELVVTADVESPDPGTPVELLVTLANQGDGVASGIAIDLELSSGLSPELVVPHAGSFDELDQRWTLDALAPDGEATLAVQARVADTAGGQVLFGRVFLTALDQLDGDLANNDHTRELAVPLVLNARALDVPSEPLLPGAAAAELLSFEIENPSLQPALLRSVAVSNESEGLGSQVQLDANLGALALVRRDGEQWNVLRSATFTNGRAIFGSLNLAIAPQSSAELRVDGGASTIARDGDIAGIVIQARLDFLADSPARIDASYPIDSGSRRAIDGMTAAQIGVRSVGSTIAEPGEQDVPLLGAILPGNGYAPDELERLLVAVIETSVSDLTARDPGTSDPTAPDPGTSDPTAPETSASDVTDLDSRASDLTALELWMDDGDSLFDAGSDVRAGAFASVPPHWVWEGDPIPVPAAGLPVFITASLSATAQTGSIRLEIPLRNPTSIEMVSGNDGPLDASVVSPDSVVVEEDQDDPVPVTWSALPLLTTSIHPGQENVVLLRLRANGAAILKQLEADFAILGSGIEEEPLSSVRLSWDVDGDGLLTSADQPIAENASSADSSAILFDSLQWSLAAEQTHLLITADIPLHALADGDQLVVSISGADAISMDGATGIGDWPLQSGICRINGMVAAQVGAPRHPLITVGPGAGPARVLELLVPADGPLDDTLEQLRFVSLGNATEGDFESLRLYRDGGDGEFSASDDVDLGPLVALAGGWSSGLLEEALGAGGARFFVGVTASSDPSDSSVVQLAIPLNGIQVRSDNDGPIDLAITGADGVRIVARGLLAAAHPARDRVLVGSELSVTLRLENPSLEAVSLTDLQVTAAGEGALELLDAPSPDGILLAPSESREFEFRFHATGAGSVRLSGMARGIGGSSEDEYRSFETAASLVSIWEPADRLVVSTGEPRSVRAQRGDQNVVLWSIELTHTGPLTRSSALLEALRLRLEDEEGDAVAPGEIVERIRITSGQGVHVSSPPGASPLVLELTPPVQIDPGQSIDLRVAVDIAAEAPLATLRMVIDAAEDMSARETIEARPVAIDAAGGFPLRSDLLVLFEAATELAIEGASPTIVRALQGSEQVRIAQLELANLAGGAMSSNIDLEQIAFLLSRETILFFERIQVLHAGTVVADHVLNEGSVLRADAPNAVVMADHAAVESSAENLLIPLNTPVTVPASSTVPLMIVADLRDDAPFGSIRAQFSDPELFLARDRQTRQPVPVVLDQGGFFGNWIRVERPAERLLLESAAHLPASVLIGARGVHALSATFHHPGDSLTSRAQILSMELECRDAQFMRLIPSTYLDAVRAFVDEQLVGEIRELPDESAIRIDLGDFLLEPGSTTRIDVKLDFAAGAPLGEFQLVGESAHLSARDANHLRNIPVEPIVPGEPALFSGLTRLQEPPRRLLVGLSSELPRNVAAGDAAVFAGTFRLTNPAEASAGSIVLTSVELQVADREFAPVAAARLDRIYMEREGEQIETVFPSQESAEAILNLPEPVEIAAGGAMDLPFFIVPGTATGVTSLRFGVSREDIRVVQPQGALFQISVEPEEGEFPLWTDAAQIGPDDLRSSFSNFPNPFSGGREQTTFVWYQPLQGQVTLRLWTLLGDRVATLFDGQLPRGLHQEVRWDGRNGKGDVVANGSYLAELTVGFEDGTEQRIRRKVAVAR